MTDELPGPRCVRASIEIDLRTIAAPAVARAQNSPSRVAAYCTRKHSQSGLSAEAPAIDLVSQIGHILPTCATIFALEDGEVVGLVARERRGRNDRPVSQLGVARVGDALSACRLVDGVVHEETVWFGTGWYRRGFGVMPRRVWPGARGLCEKRGGEEGAKHDELG